MAKPKYTTFTGVKAEDISGALKERFPAEAYKGVPGGADLTDINTGFMIERVTSVFGPKGLGWNLLYNPNDLTNTGDSGRVVARLSATFVYSLWKEDGDKIDCAFPVSGVNENKFNYVDEGVRTSCVGAAIKWLCFQNDVYKGQFDHHDAQAEQQAAKRAAGNGNSNGSAPATTGNGNGTAPVDDSATIATASWDGLSTHWATLRNAAVKAGIQDIPTLEPGKATRGEVRTAYADLKAKIDAALQTA
jgi:hypothetical protein